MLRSTFLLATVLAACATAPSDDDVGGAGGKADGSAPTITFKKNFTHAASGTLLAGSPVRIKYDLARLTECRGTSGGSDQWGVTGWAKFDNAEPKSFAVSQLVDGRAT